MNIKILTIFTTLLLGFPALIFAKEGNELQSSQNSQINEQFQNHRLRQQQEDEQFQELLKNIPPEQQGQAIIDHQNKRFRREIDMQNEMHQKQMQKLKEHLAQNRKMSETEKRNAINKAEARHQARIERARTIHEKSIKHWKTMKIGSNLPPDLKNEELQKMSDPRTGEEKLQEEREGSKERQK